MIDSQTFAIMRDPESLPGAAADQQSEAAEDFRIDAGRKSGLPPSFISAISYLESWGNAKAESWAGPKGIMQIAAATARQMGLRIVYATKYKISTEKKLVRRKETQAGLDHCPPEDSVHGSGEG